MRKSLGISQTNLYLYSALSKIPYLNSYKGKIMLVAFLGTHVPLLSLLIYFVISASFPIDIKVRVIAIALIATLIGTALTLYALHNLLAPVTLTFLAMRHYLTNRQLSSLPTNFTDEAGMLMADTFHTLKKLDEVIEHIASYDDLTGLPNRILFDDRLQQVISQNKNNQLFAVIYLSLDRLKNINNLLGYEVGNLVLRNAAQKLTSCLSHRDILARHESNKFAIIQTNIKSVDEVVELAEKIIKELTKSISINNNEVFNSISIGISIYPSEPTEVDSILGNAVRAMDRAKAQGQNKYQFYCRELNNKLQERLMLEKDLHNAINNGEMLLHYQPQVCLRTGKIMGVEALLRWYSPIHGFVSPAKFIPIAEETGLIISIGEWVLRTACAQNCSWQLAGFPLIKVAVNISSRQFKEQNLVEIVTQVLQETGLKANYLELEITESLIIDNIQQAITTMNQLHDMGISLSLDDFGTGYSSLNHLKRLPIDLLKIDQSFVRELTIGSDDAAIVKAIISLAHNLQLSVIAEGVETEAQLEYLRRNGCDEIQGYYISRPVPAEVLAKQLQQEKEVSCSINNLAMAA
ncbi:putative bifunctional diguanylate cyclase/phosphodiesterase [Chlorogloea sp. CCALA 695]|uniref:putative bifunctional diguanylate cyclase/phosphodiesterase n=1 Tax=Chlorogloea sp. CCALA 695 TaxID=2107693 RepID=UPI000D06B2F1|nr:GGDEF domain-containing phosphodiesterase [Chlorogloea sp. CCALA 695]PSB30711.1 GGDEF-domain containing protein [Chlorogloea sp. CCALA 695]